MDRRKKRTSTNQYMMYIDLMEKDHVFATGRVPRDGDPNYLTKKWKELSDKLNTCSGGPTLTAEEWRKRLNDWKNTTRCKYRRSISGEKDISLTSLELKALELFGKAPNISGSDTLSIHLKSEKDDCDEEIEHQRTSESFQKELQAAVDEAICGDEDEEAITEEVDEPEEVLSETITHTSGGGNAGGGSGGYRTIVVDNTAYADDDNHEEHVEYIQPRRHTLNTSSNTNTIVTGSGTTTVTKLINGEIPMKRFRTNNSEQIIYEVKKAPVQTKHIQGRPITIHQAGPSIVSHHQQQQHQQQHHQPQHHHDTSTHLLNGISSQDAREISRHLKRLADVKTEKLKFEIEKFKFNNPGFNYNYPL